MKWKIVFCFFVILFAVTRPLHAQEEEPQRVYEVSAGDTLITIAERFGLPVEAIISANNLANPDLIYAGQQLVIPGLTAPPAEPETEAIMRLATYRLRPGDQLDVLARRFGVQPADILRANGLARPDQLLTETEIRVPVKVADSLPAPVLSLRVSPAVVQGQTGIVDITVSKDVKPEGAYGDQPLTFFFLGDGYPGYRYFALIPTPALLSPEVRTLRVSVDGAEIEQPMPTLAGSYETQHIVLPPAKGDLLEPTKVRDELGELREIWGISSPERFWSGRFRFPIGEGYVQTSPYGTRRSYNGGPVASFHEGSDWSAIEGTPILAPAPGVVVLAEDLIVRGGAVVIDHGQGVYSNFWHLSQIDVEPGQKVGRGEQVGLVGTTGLSTGAHLHWEVRVDGVAVNPLQWSEVSFPFAPTVDAS
ncbi:MAG: peptidoglycan DD-metalloendopeptidase family protein [Caldilineales bacterium]|nr:peptidoglycan DD-metalloendopeptidase family protein [Caldilineales bacterium]